MRLKLQFLVVLIPLVLSGLTALAPSALAGNVQIYNDVHVSADAGGNSGSNVTTGGASVNISIHGSVNGTELPPVDIATTSPSGTLHVDVRNDFTTGAPSSSVDIRFSDGGSAGPSSLPTGTSPFASSGLPRIFQDLRPKLRVHAVPTSTPTSTAPAPQFHSSMTVSTSSPHAGTSTASRSFLGELPRFAASLLRSIWSSIGSIFKF